MLVFCPHQPASCIVALYRPRTSNCRCLELPSNCSRGLGTKSLSPHRSRCRDDYCLRKELSSGPCNLEFQSRPLFFSKDLFVGPYCFTRKRLQAKKNIVTRMQQKTSHSELLIQPLLNISCSKRIVFWDTQQNDCFFLQEEKLYHPQKIDVLAKFRVI